MHAFQFLVILSIFSFIPNAWGATFYGAASDPLGDALNHPSSPGGACCDLRFAYVKVDTEANVATVGARFGPGYIRNQTRAQFYFDIDQSSATGWLPGSVFLVDNIGFELYMNVGANDDTAYLTALSGFGLPPTAGGVFPNSVTYFPDGFEAVIPWTSLGDPDGLLDTKLTSSMSLTSEMSAIPSVSTTILDAATNEGLQPISTSLVPIPSAAILFASALGLFGSRLKRSPENLLARINLWRTVRAQPRPS